MSQALKCCPTYPIKQMGWIEVQNISLRLNHFSQLAFYGKLFHPPHLWREQRVLFALEILFQ